MSKPLVEIRDIQIRFGVELEGVFFVTTWYGPKDIMRFAAVKKIDSPKDPESLARLEKHAKELFTIEIEKLEKKFHG
jgi:hypothetical protein